MKNPIIFFTCMLVMLFFSQCKKDCMGNQQISKVLPDNNPIFTSILIEGSGFSANTQVFFDGIPSEEVVFDTDSTLAARIPDMDGKTGLVDLKLLEGDCETTVIFEVTPTFEDLERPNSPDIFFPKETNKAIVNLVDTVANPSFRWYENIWGRLQRLQITSADVQNNGLLHRFGGYEEVKNVFSTQYNELAGEYDVKANKLTMTITYEDQATIAKKGPNEKFTGGFYRITLLTPKGQQTYNILFLQSDKTGRQYLFKSVRW